MGPAVVGGKPAGCLEEPSPRTAHVTGARCLHELFARQQYLDPNMIEMDQLPTTCICHGCPIALWERSNNHEPLPIMGVPTIAGTKHDLQLLHFAKNYTWNFRELS